MIDTVVRPKKPYPSFPLSAHGNGQWYKTKVIGGKKRFFYFGPWDVDPRGDEALRRYTKVANEIHAGRVPTAPAPDPDDVTAEDLVNRYLAFAERRVPKEIGFREFGDVRLACLIHFLDAVGETTLAQNLVTPDGSDRSKRTPVMKLRDYLDGRMGIAAFNRNIQKIRSMLKWAYHTAKLLRVPLHEDVVLKKKKKSLEKRERRLRDAEKGSPVFTPDECRRIVTAAADDAAHGSPLLAMILLAMNSGWGASQVSSLPRTKPAIDLDAGIVNWYRIKSEEPTQFVLWPATVWALREYEARRPQPVDPADDDLMFITKFGNRWVREVVKRDENGLISDVCPDDAIGKEFNKLQARLGIKRRGRGFNGFRYTFATVANATVDKDAVRRVMGHALTGMDPHYVRGQFPISLERLGAATRFVGESLLGHVGESCPLPSSRSA